MSWKRFRPEHDKMFNDKRWPAIKAFVWQRDGGRCQICKREGIEAGVDDGYIKSGFACHHVIPFESAKSQTEMERLFLDTNNIILVCKDCHAKIHREMKSHTKEKVSENKRRGAERRASWLDPHYEENNRSDNPNWQASDEGCERPDNDKSAEGDGVAT